MAGNRKTLRTLKDDDSYMENDLDESLLQSPAKRLPLRNAMSHTRQPSSSQGHHSADTLKEHEATLRQELANVRKVNEAIEGVLESLEKAKQNMKNVNATVGNASALLNIWTRILSQTEHNQRLILDPTWQGASQDVADTEDEAQAKQQAAEKRETEEQERRAAATKKAEEEERKRSEIPTTTSKPRAGTRGRATSSRGTATGRPGHVPIGASGSTGASSGSRGISSTRRVNSGIGRGTASRSTRGRG